MSHLTSLLESFGISGTEARVYECGLFQGDTDVATISRKLRMNRSTVYHAVHELSERGLLQKRLENGTLILSMLREDGLRAYFNYEEAKLRERKESLEHIFARLPKERPQDKVPEIEHFSGFEGIRMALETAFRAKTKQWDILAPRRNFFSDIEEDFASYYLSERKRRKITSRSLWEKTEDNIRVSNEIVRERQPRYLPRTYNGTFRSVMILFDDRVLFISSAKEMQALLISSTDIVSTLRMQFNALWDVSETI